MKKTIILLCLCAIGASSVYPQTSIDWATITAGVTKEISIENERKPEKFEVKLTNLNKRIINHIELEYKSNKEGDINNSSLSADANGNISIDIKALLQAKGKYNNFLKTNSDDEFSITLIDDNSTTGAGATNNTLKIIYKLKATDPLSTIEKQKEIAKYVKTKYGAFASIYEDKKNNIIKSENTVHVFIDEYGQTYFTSLPTTAREDFDYQFHIFYYPEKNTGNIYLEYDGTYDPSFDIYGSDQISKNQFSGTDRKNEEKVDGPQEKVFGKIGPFTNTFALAIKKETIDDKKTSTIISKTIKVAKVHHISITAGLISSFLSNPSDFEKFPLANGDTTLIANDPSNHGMVTLMATFYPMPRNLLFAPTNWKERIGFVVGTRIDRDFNENFLCGLSCDLARGISITGGAHYSRVNKLAFDGNFELGKTPFTGDLKTKKEWQLGWYVGVCIDLRVFGLLFKH